MSGNIDEFVSDFLGKNGKIFHFASKIDLNSKLSTLCNAN